MEHKKKLRFKQETSRKDRPWWERAWDRTGYRGKTLWDWQVLLFVPVSIALIASLITLYQTVRQQDVEKMRSKAEQELAEKRAEDETLQAYLDQMSELILDKELRTSKEDSSVRTLARARTLVVLDALDSSERQRRVLRFLYETELTQAKPDHQPIISLDFASMPNLVLGPSRILEGADLTLAKLPGAQIAESNLEDSNLSGANLEGANLSGTNLEHATLLSASLLDTNLSDADLSDADLSDGQGLWNRGARMYGANLEGANLNGANLTNTEVTKEQLEQARSLKGATMPDGQTLGSDATPNGPTFEAWLKDKNSREED